MCSQHLGFRKSLGLVRARTEHEQREYGTETGGLEEMGDLEGKEESRQLPKILRVVGRV